MEYTHTQTQKWATFTYTGKQTTFITNLLKRTNIKIAFHTNNTNYNQLTHKTDKYTQSGVYKLTWPDCNKAYVSQTGKSFLVRYNENKQAFRYNSHTSKLAQHLVEQAHSFGTVHNLMQILHYQKKSAHFNTVERYYIHTESIANNHLNYNQNIFPNAILTLS